MSDGEKEALRVLLDLTTAIKDIANELRNIREILEMLEEKYEMDVLLRIPTEQLASLGTPSEVNEEDDDKD
jgi:hypothetical protein